MIQQYRLDCSQCGTSQPIETRHAGSSIRCSNCQTPIEVPKLRELKQLEPIRSEADTRCKRGWGQLSGGFFATGLLMLVIAIGSGGYVHRLRKTYSAYAVQPKVENLTFHLDINDASLTDSWRAWEQLRERRQIVQRDTPAFIKMRDRVKRLDIWSYFFYGLATVGLVAMISSMLLRPKLPN